MRAPSDMPRPGRRRRERKPGRGRVILIVAAAVVFVVLLSLRAVAGFYTDFLWFDSVGQSGVFTGVLQAKATLVLLFTATFFVLLWVNLYVADRLAPTFRPAGPEEEIVARYRELVGNRTRLVRVLVAGVFALIAGAPAAGRWQEWILFNNRVDFGTVDAQFGRDIGFYVFELPFLTSVVGWLFAALVIVLIVTAVAHYMNGGIRIQVPAPDRVTPQVKVHLSVLLGVLALVKAVGYYLQQFELTVSTRGTVDGATYTDVNAQLPAIRLLILIALAAFALFIVNIKRKGWALPVLGVGLWAFVAVVAGGIVPAVVQRVRVEPDESSREREFIVRNIEATRAALGLDDVQIEAFDGNQPLTDADLAANAEVIRNIRLWDTGVLTDTYQQLQALRPFYRINDVDVDRYVIDGEVTQVMISARELHTDEVPQSSWEARHLAFTHGYGVVLAPANAKDANGRPVLRVEDVPVRDNAGLDITQPAIYVGEDLDGYVIVNTQRQEIDFQDAEGATVFTEYDGADGVNIGSFFRRAAFALRFGDINPLISGNIRGDSRILLMRDVHDRVQALAPFLHFDSDPYPVVVGGRIQWVIDGYTTTDRFPYAQRAVIDGVPGASGLDHRFNYARNAVKVVVDAYDGSATFYIVDPDDPIIQAYDRAFPDLFTSEAVPDELRAHFRYPEDLFRVQSNMWGRYHLDNPDDFYNNNGAWVVSRDPGAPAPTVDTSGTTTTTDPNAPPRQQDRIDPYYLLTHLPGRSEESFVMLRPFVPITEGDTRPVLTGFLVADSDPDNYGQLTSFETPPTEQVDGPAIVAGTIGSFDPVSQAQTQLCRSGSRCVFGNLVFVPIEQSLLYVQPMYIISEQNPVPLLRRVIVEFNGDVGFGTSLHDALLALPSFNEVPETQEEPAVGDDGEPGGEDPVAPGEDPPVATVGELLQQAETLFAEADAALTAGDLGTFADRIAEARALVEQARALIAEEAGATTTTTVPASTTSTTATA